MQLFSYRGAIIADARLLQAAGKTALPGKFGYIVQIREAGFRFAMSRPLADPREFAAMSEHNTDPDKRLYRAAVPGRPCATPLRAATLRLVERRFVGNVRASRPRAKVANESPDAP